ncbi:uncharacterized protein A1O9_08272 [Exophiala aquamarina CBS 119918]|uniref:Uncharacterized protein n=1 Tax=Exophiala aquamarina CBS 119918 TaxID=1182545 RepID=A0A072P719_9EURO|nr:uncharacterized protein A1O9_08272 [Exophiala aquamarina CBS 119918]KEF55522.1 hypothetical protein A1O9_08272 [Exophiala aquamarina CBS 119918]
MASDYGRETRVCYANSTRTSIGFNNGNGLKVVSPRMSAEQGDHEWYYNAFPSRKSLRASDQSVKLIHETKAFREYLNKPLPALPVGLSPRSSLTSATGGVNSYTGRTASHGKANPSPALKSIPTDSKVRPTVVPGHVASIDDSAPMVLDTSTAAQFAFAMAGVDLDIKDIVDNHLASLGTGHEGHPHLDEAEEAEKQRATEEFYVGVKPEEAPGQFYAPLLDETSGYGNYRDGMEDFPEMWQPDTEWMTPPLVAGSQKTAAEVGKPVKAPKTILKPKSRKAPKHDIHMADGDSTNAVSPTVFPPPTEQIAYTDSLSKTNKRTASDSFSAQTTIHHTIEDEEESDEFLDVLPSKKLRVTEHAANEEIQRVQSLRAISVHSDDSDYSDTEADTPNSTSYSGIGIPSPKRTSPTLTSFPGQFTSFEAPYLERKKTRHVRNNTVDTFPFGHPLHPNNIYTHTNFILDPDADTLDYTQQMLDRLPVRNMAWEHAISQSNRAAKVLTRTPSEENLRREAHLECAGARLEGVAVGQYRYYQGHMSVEEYVAANMCVCWGGCYCSKLCTRFGDVLCPCSSNILLPEQ